MSFFTEYMSRHTGAVPCLFYPMAKKMGTPLSTLLSDSRVQADLLVDIARSLEVGAVIRMTELWCEAASFGMKCDIMDNQFPKLGEPICPEVNSLLAVQIPQIENAITTPLIDAVRLAVPQLEQPLIVGATGPYTLCSVLSGSENFMINCMMDPDAIHCFLDKVTDFLVEYISAYKSVGAAGVILAEPSASMISPGMMDAFSSTYIQKIIEAVQDDTFSVIYHNCGAVNKHMESISCLDADAFHFGSEVDLGRALKLIDKRKFVMGNIDPRMFFLSSRSDIESRVSSLLSMYGSTSNWRLSTGCDLAPGVSIDNVEYFLQCMSQ